MLEGLVAWVLNNYLGKYVENLNTDQLSVALLSGKVELENLPLKKDALRHLGLPVEVRAGFIGKVQLQVPVRQIRSAPWVIAIEKLYLVAAPVNLDEWDPDVESLIAHERKVALLDALEAGWRARTEAADASYYATSYSSWLSYGTGLLANIVENLQLKLNDVHIRFEDGITCAPSVFACGLTVEALAAESCDAEWRRGVALLPPADPDGCSFKILELQKLAVYWDPITSPNDLLANCSISELRERMTQTWLVSHRYMLEPASATARVRRERTAQPLRSRTRPRLSAHLTLNTVALNLNSRQYSEIVGCALGLEQIAKLREFRELRPAVPVRGHARDWWIYALKCHTPNTQFTEPQPSWESCALAARQAREYVKTCLFALSNPAATLPAADNIAKDQYEWRTPLHTLKALREVAMRKVPKATPVATPDNPASSGRSMLVHWFPQWWGWYGQPPADQSEAAPPPAPPPAAPPDLEEEILDVLADSLENNTLLKRDTVFGKFEFVLSKGCLNLSTETEESDTLNESTDSTASSGVGSVGVELQFSAVCVRVESRPRASSLLVAVSLGSVALRERVTPATLFPVLVAPMGMIRENLSAMNPSAATLSWCRAQTASPAPPAATAPAAPAAAEPLFQLTYEKKPFGLNCDYKLFVKSQSLEVVWCAAAARWALGFARGAWGAAWARPRLAYASVRDSTKQRLITHIEHMMHPHPGDRRSWQVELDISAPQILFVEDLCDRDASVLVVDFGRLRLGNATGELLVEAANTSVAETSTAAEDEELFMTPCSTPPASLLSPADPPLHPAAHAPLDAHNLHTRLYDRYKIELSDLQILVGRARDNWKYAHTKTTSSLHLLDRFSISLQAERRVVHTSDPQYPTATLCGSLPALVVHLSEQKLLAVRSVIASSALLSDTSKDQPSQGQPHAEEEEESSVSSETEKSEHSSHHHATLFMLQFAIDQMSLEVQSRGRSIAEVQVCGVKAAMTARPCDLSLSLSVHSLLLVDALQTYGPDFELLVASHKHVGMDTASGSIRGSEPTSPTSPTSPASPTGAPHTHPHAHPHALQHALHSLRRDTTTPTVIPDMDRTSPAPSWATGASFNINSTTPGAIWGNHGAMWGPSGPMWPPPGPPGGTAWYNTGGWGAAGLVDSEALIAVELCIVKGEGDSEDLRIANILFNNLDIIANQETIVELIGFTQRVLGTKSAPKKVPSDAAFESKIAVTPQTAPEAQEFKKETRTEITFDFHRLGVLLLRAAMLDGNVVAKKIATATLSEAKIQATIDGTQISMGGSLGGVQVVSLCEGAGVHSRVLSAGRALQPATAAHQDDDKALLFTIERTVRSPADAAAPAVEVRVSMHVASVWYTHSGPLLRELQSCLTEFKQYLANLARSIRAAAADMAIGLVHPRGESLYANPKLSQSMEGVSPRRRTVSVGYSMDDPPDLASDNIVLSISIELESPVVVVPRAAHSTQVFVAHLGRMSLGNRPGHGNTAYRVRVRDISLATLDVAEMLKTHQLTSENMEEIYDVSRGKPVLHNTALQVSVNYCAGDDDMESKLCEVSGKIVGGLHVSARREQYEQLLETIRWVSSTGDSTDSKHTSAQAAHQPANQPSPLVEPAVPTLRLDPQLRAAVLAVPPPHPPRAHPQTHTNTPLKVVFELPTFTLELRADLGAGERSLVELAFREFTVRYQHLHRHETLLQVSLHSVTMEDLTKDPESKHRLLMQSHTPQVPPKAVFVSKSCPDFVTEYPADDLASVSSLQHMKSNSYSLPSKLNVTDQQAKRNKRDSKCGVTPPCSPTAGADEDERSELSPDDNLVWVSVHTRHHQHPLFVDKYNRVSKLTKVDFNCLNLVVNIDSWVAVLDFFGVANDEPDGAPGDGPQPQETDTHSTVAEHGITQMETSIRSLSVVVVTSRGEACRALVSRVRVVGRADASIHTRRITGSLGALVLTDLTPHSPLWRDRFRTQPDNALTFDYQRLSVAEAASAGHETSLTIEMGPVTYVHTKRFVGELQAFARDFSLLRKVILQARLKVSVRANAELGPARTNRTLMRIRCQAPVIVLPVSGRARAALLAELHHLQLDNCFKYAGDADTYSTRTDPTLSVRELVDARRVQLEGLSLWCARGGRGLRVRRLGPALLPAPAQLTLHIEHNMSGSHNVPDMTIQGTLTTLQCALDPSQYKLVRGVLAHNLGECVHDLLPPVPPTVSTDQVWTTTSLKLDLHDVTMKLEPEHGVSSLACINFIKSRLLVETYSDLSQDIDLVSQEILVSDTRYAGEPANRRGNVFSHIVTPMPDHPHTVQAEVHARKRRESSAYTILVNNMRLMAILDWWEAAHQFLMQQPPPPADPDQPPLEDVFAASRGLNLQPPDVEDPLQMELKLNVTDSQVVLVEDASVWDTNAVILKSTTVITYKAADALKPVSCELNELEVFSCVLGLEEETALSIVDPAALHIVLNKDHVLQVSTTVITYKAADALKPVSCELNELEVFSCVLGLEEETALSIVDPAALHIVLNKDHVLQVSTTVITYKAADALKPVSCELNELEVFSCVLGLEEETALSIVDPAALHIVLNKDHVLQVSTTVITYKAADALKPVSCELNELEVFSCVLGLEEETALSIVDPAALHIVLNKDHVLQVSTTVITYKAADALKPVSCELNELEVFSCVLGLEEETALSIVDPAALHIVLNKDHVLQIDMGTLNLRLSYHDMRMFAAMLQSLPVQARAALSGKGGDSETASAPANSEHMRPRSAPRLYTPKWARRVPPPAPPPPQRSSVFPLRAVQVNAECVTLCVIDDCLDSDVPLLEVSLSELQVEQDLRKVEEAFEDPLLVQTPSGAAGTIVSPKRAGAGGGRLSGVLSADYYNRTLSGWEPVIEPWRFETTWENTLTSGLSLGRVQTEIVSQDILNTNVTSSLIELCQLVRANWTADYYAPGSAAGGADHSPKGSPAGHRRRSPFVPYALRNHTGHRLWFTTLLTTSDVLHESSATAGAWCGPDDSWVLVRAGETEPFSFGARRARTRAGEGGGGGKGAGHPSGHAPAPLHRLALRLDGWAPPDPVCVDRVGVYFRHLTHTKTGAEARIVFEVSLEGSARKLVTVRSALQLVNTLPHPVEVRVDHANNTAQWTGSSRSATVAAGAAWSAPLGAGAAALWARPIVRNALPAAPAPLDWRTAPALLHAECRAPPDTSYRFCCVVIRERFPPDRGVAIAGHTLTLVPALRLENLLPLELQYRASAPDDTSMPRAAGTLPPADTKPFHEVNVEEGVEISVKLEGFGWSSPLSVGGAGSANSFSARLKLRDSRGRRLYLNARVTIKKTDGIKVSISAAYWLVNRTGLPLVFRAEGAAGEAAGQFEEHEVARMVAPLLFSFAEADGGPTVSARLGRGVAANPEWCSPFGLGPGVGTKRLEARGEAERVYAVGVCARAGRGRYRHTNIVTLAPRYQLHNNTSHRLQFAQRCTATTLNDPGAIATHVSAVSGCYLPWHWARWEREQLLCVRILTPPGNDHCSAAQLPRTGWSGGFRIDAPRTLHVACREVGGAAYEFVRVEVVLQGCTLFVVLSDAECAPEPLRIDNYSAVAIMFHQVGCAEECVVGAHASVRWALPEPEGAAALALRAPGGPRTTLPLDTLPSAHHLLYQNFIYVVFTATQSRDGMVAGGGKAGAGGAAEGDGGLVLEVPLNSTRVVLGRKRYGDRSQLWRRGPNDQLIHEGSSPPQPTDALLSDDSALTPHSMVLDIEDSAPRPGRASALVLRRADPRRASTQAWRLLPPARMACAHANLCVQPDGGLMALTPGSRVVLGLPESRSGGTMLHGVPAEQAVAWQTLRPGSGRLDVSLTADGPTKLLRIHDHKEPDSGWIEGEDEHEKEVGGAGREWGVRVSFAGVSVSLVSRAPPAELVHARLAGLQLELAGAQHSPAPAPATARLALTLTHMQWDNQLLGTPSPVLLYCLPDRSGTAMPALHAVAELMRTPANRYNAYFFRHLVVALRPLAVRLEERLMLKLWAWAAPPDEESAHEAADESEYEARRVLDELTSLHATRVYCALIKIIPSQIRLSMCTANKLEPGLATLKKRLGLTLIRFEDASVELEPFVRAHPFDTPASLARQLLQHFRDELKWQAAKILGSVDFLGNPLGFVADVSEGVSGFFLEGNVSALLKNVTHGISNSAAKVTESLGDGLERVVGDEAHEETRRRIRSAAAGAHIAAGFRGLGLGILGGMTSLVKHSYEGATQEGIPGFLAGVGKGLVGTVTKPVIGVLDLAAETASALRDTSKRSDKLVPGRVRAPRCAVGAGGLLPRYCAAQAAGAALLYALNGNDYSEQFLAYRTVRDTPHDIRALLSTTYIRICTCKHHQPQIVMETHLSNLVSCVAVSSEGAHYVELGVRGGGGGAGGGAEGGREAVRRPRVQCDSSELAAWVAKHAAYARQLYHEQIHTLLPSDQ